MPLFLGIDIGSTTVKVVALDREGALLAHSYLRSKGRPQGTLLRALDDLRRYWDLSRVTGVGFTGSGGQAIAGLVGGQHVNELIAQTRAVGELYPEARTVIEIGGQDSKLLSLELDERSGRMVLVDFAMNTLCAAGTGSFLDQQAERLAISIEDEFSSIALQSRNPARIAGRCTVFAKSDMIHLQQKGTLLADILAGLCLALTRNFKSVVSKGKAFIPPILFQGGLAYNQAVVRAFETVLGLEPGQLIVPDHHALMPALGTALVALEEHGEGSLPRFRGFEALQDLMRSPAAARKSMPPLAAVDSPSLSRSKAIAASNGNAQPTPVYLGIDVGSISTNVVLIDEHARVLARRYLPTAGRPLQAVSAALRQIGRRMARRVHVRGVGATGSGRYLTGHFVGADVIRTEITAQARAAVAIDPTVDTIFEIGGQDSKLIRIDHGAVVDFAMNNACAAGTGSFLEEQADRLHIDIRDDFSGLALSSRAPTCLGERCTVFMESDLVHHQQQGAQLPDLTAGLAYSIAQNFLNRVVNGRALGRNIFFQGGVASNGSVVAAFRRLTGRAVTVPPHHDVTGAIGAAILAMENSTRDAPPAPGDAHSAPAPLPPTRFHGFDLSDRTYATTTFECRACPNLCEVNKVAIAGDRPLFSGARCDRFDEAQRRRTRLGDIPDLFAERNAMLLGDYAPPSPERNGKTRLALPRALTFHELFPFWRAFCDTLGIELVLSAPTNPTIMNHTSQHAVAETCFPAKLLYGHVVDLLDKEADFLLLPSVINHETTALGQDTNNYCPFIPSMPHLVAAHLDLAGAGHRPLTFPLHLLWQPARKQDLKLLAHSLGTPLRRVLAASRQAEAAQRDFQATMRRRGRGHLRDLPPDCTSVVIVGRPYNACDPGACQDLPAKLRRLGVLPIPIDYLPLESVDVSDRYANMFWRSGQAILAAASIISNDPRLQAIYLTNFNCGPDSFITSFFREIMGDKPFLELEIDQHTADAGVVTRCEAFFESLSSGNGQLR